MEDKEIICKLLDIYENALREMPIDSVKHARDYLVNKKLQHGFCYAADKILDIYIKFEIWIPNRLSPYLYITPIGCYSIEEIIDSLQWRINYLKNQLTK